MLNVKPIVSNVVPVEDVGPVFPIIGMFIVMLLVWMITHNPLAVMVSCSAMVGFMSWVSYSKRITRID